VLECIGGLLGLAWQRAEEVTVLADLDETGRVALPQHLPSAAQCAELAGLARQGCVYEIEECLAHLRQIRPECGEFCRAVEECLAALDFEGIAAHFADEL